MKLLPIASSSEANCTLIFTENTVISIDMGISLKKLKSHTKSLDAIFVSHEHSDHWKGAGYASRFFECPIYMNEYSYEEKKSTMGTCDIQFVSPKQKIEVKDLTITHFSTKHDVRMSFGYLVKEADKKALCYITDTGMITPLMETFIEQADLLFIESDYDETLLQEYTGYEKWLKDRISSNFGHLSNQYVMSFLKNFHKKFSTVICGHLSPRTNTQEALLKIASEQIPNTTVLIAPLSEPIEI